MVDVVVMQAGEAITVDTKDNTAVVCYGNGDGNLWITDEQNNTVAVLSPPETYTLPYNSGKYVLTYNANAGWEAYIFVVHYFAI